LQGMWINNRLCVMSENIIKTIIKGCLVLSLCTKVVEIEG
jgi:hypothetical protein